MPGRKRSAALQGKVDAAARSKQGRYFSEPSPPRQRDSGSGDAPSVWLQEGNTLLWPELAALQGSFPDEPPSAMPPHHTPPNGDVLADFSSQTSGSDCDPDEYGGAIDSSGSGSGSDWESETSPSESGGGRGGPGPEGGHVTRRSPDRGTGRTPGASRPLSQRRLHTRAGRRRCSEAAPGSGESEVQTPVSGASSGAASAQLIVAAPVAETSGHAAGEHTEASWHAMMGHRTANWHAVGEHTEVGRGAEASASGSESDWVSGSDAE